MCSLATSVNHILTGEQRRKLFPPEVGIIAGASATLKASDVKVSRAFHTPESGERLFYQTVAPADREPTCVLVWFHGYTAHADMDMQSLSEVARGGALVVMPDLPGHGRSDGMLAYTPDWWKFVEAVWDFVDAVVQPLRGPSQKLFAAGHSLGGGLTACLGVQRPTYFDGLVLVAPMLYVSDEVKPHWIVQQAFRRLLGPWKLSWPIAPSKDISCFDFRVPEQGPKLGAANPLSMGGLKPRLATAEQIAFEFPEWMEARMGEVKAPLLILHGTADKVTDPAASKRLYDLAQAEDKALKLYEGAFHGELLGCNTGHAEAMGVEFLPEQIAQTKEAIKDIVDWIQARAR